MSDSGFQDQGIRDEFSVLYVDDDPDLQGLVSAFLENNEGIKVDACSSAENALRLPDFMAYDIIVSEYRLPGMNGITFLEKTRNLSEDIPFIFFTSISDPEVIIDILNAGADFLIRKGEKNTHQRKDLSGRILSAARKRHDHETIRDDEKRFHDLADLLPQVIFEIDLDLNITYANKLGITSAGYASLDQILGQSILLYIVPADHEKLQDAVKKHLQGTSPGYGEYLAQNRAGSPFPVAIYASPIRRDDLITGFRGIVVDISEQKKIEEKLRESERRMSALFRYSPVAFTLVSAIDGIFVDINEVFMRNTGYTRDDVIGKNANEIGIFVDSESYGRMVTLLKSEGYVQNMEQQCRKKTGEVNSCLFSSCTIMIGDKPHILSTIEDITYIKIKESAYHTLVRSMVGKTGIDSLQSITRNISTWLSADCVMVCRIESGDSTMKVLTMDLDGSLSSGYSYPIKGTEGEMVIKEGFCLYEDNITDQFPASIFLTQHHFRGFIGIPLINSDKETFGLLSILFRNPFQQFPFLREILEIISVKASAEIEHSQIESILIEKEHQLAEAMQLAHLVNWEFDVISGMYTFNDDFYTLYGTTADREGGYQMTAERYFRIFFHPDDRYIMEERIRKIKLVTNPEYSDNMEHRIIRRDGEIRHISVSIRVTLDDAGRVVKTRGVNQDITDRKLTELSLKKANRQFNMLSEITRHDILNKISVIHGCLMVIEHEMTHSSCGDYFRAMESAARTIQNQIEFTRIYQNIGTIEPQWLQIYTILPWSSVPAGVSMTAEVDRLSIFADPMFERVFFNLLDNSIRHGEHVSEIQVSMYQSARSMILTWEDNGIGIPPDRKEMIFERDYGENTGLGLFLTREILSLTGISIHETGVYGNGARFEMEIPEGGFRMRSHTK